MKQNSCRLKLSAGTAGTGTCPGKCHLDLEKHMPLLVGVLLRFWGESSSFELCRSSSDAESWAGQDWVQTAQFVPFPRGTVFIHLLSLKGRNLFFFPSCLFFRRRGKDWSVWEKGRSGEKAWYVPWYKTTKGIIFPFQWQQSCLSLTVLLCLSPLVVEIISATCCRVNESGFFLSCMYLVQSYGFVILVYLMAYHCAQYVYRNLHVKVCLQRQM